MKNIEKLQRVLTRELVEKNVDMVGHINCMKIESEYIETALRPVITEKVNVSYLFTLSKNHVFQPDKNIEIYTTLDLSELNKANDSSQEQDILAYIVYGHINSLEEKIWQELDREDYEDKYIKKLQEKVQQQFDNKKKCYVKSIDEIRVSPQDNKYMNTPLKPEVLVTPDGDKFENNSPTKPIPLEKINLGSLTLEEKDGKLAITYSDGFTRYIK